MNVLFVFPEMDMIGPRNIRIKNISNFLAKEKLNVYIAKSNLSKNTGYSPNEFFIPNGWLFSFILKYKVLKFFFIKILFPDIYILNYKTTKTALINIVNNYKIETVIFIKPFSLYFISKNLKKIFPNIKIIYDIGDPLYYNSAYLNRNLFKFIVERNVLKYADGIIVTNQNTKQYYNKIYNYPLDKISIVPQGVSVELISENKINQVKVQNKKWRFFYAGLFYKNLRNPYAFFNAIESFNKGEFQLSCYGVNKEFVSDNYKNISFYPRLHQTDLVKVLNNADVLLFIDNSSGIQTPGKIFELLAFKKVIFCVYSNVQSETIQFLKKFDHVLFVKNNIKSIENGLLRLSDFKPKFDYDPTAFSWQERSKAYENVLNNL